MLNRLKQWLKKTWKWLRTNLFTKQMILPTVIGELVFWSPLIVIGLLALIISPTYWAVFGAVYFVWITLLPAIPI